MTQYNTLNVKLPYSQLDKLKSGIKNVNELTLKISSKLLGILMMRIIFYIICFQLTHKFRGFLKFLQIIPQLI